MSSPPASEYAPDGPYRPAPPPPSPPPRVSPLAAFKFVFASEAPLTTVLLGTVLLFVPFVGQIVLAGYKAEVFQRLVRREENAMPRLTTNDVLPLLSRGAPAFFAEYLLGMAMTLPPLMVIGPLIFLARDSVVRSEQGPLLVVVAMCGAAAVAFVLAAPIWNAVITRAALTEDLAASLKPKAVLSYAGKTWGTVLVAYFVFSLLAIALGMVGLLACFVGCYPALVLGQLAAVHLRWQIYESQLARGGAFIPVKPRVAPSAPAMAYAYGGPGAYARAQNENSWPPRR